MQDAGTQIGGDRPGCRGYRDHDLVQGIDATNAASTRHQPCFQSPVRFLPLCKSNCYRASAILLNRHNTLDECSSISTLVAAIQSSVPSDIGTQSLLLTTRAVAPATSIAWSSFLRRHCNNQLFQCLPWPLGQPRQGVPRQPRLAPQPHLATLTLFTHQQALRQPPSSQYNLTTTGLNTGDTAILYAYCFGLRCCCSTNPLVRLSSMPPSIPTLSNPTTS